jgi:hypothetical protein
LAHNADISLRPSKVASSPAIPTTPLRFLSTVNTARIPLYLAVGPSLSVVTTSGVTEEWFASLLLSKAAGEDATGREWWACARAQSPIGILVKVDPTDERLHNLRVTEILFYGTIAVTAQTALPTPPSSSPDATHTQPEQLPELTVHAIPLSSDLLYQNDFFEIPLPSPGLGASTSGPEVEMRFLPPAHAPPAAPDSPKRMRDIFDEAKLARKKAKAKGGEGVSAAAANAYESQRTIQHRKSLSIDTKAVPSPDSRPNSAHSTLARPSPRQLSRSPSISSDTRPLSRKGVSDGLVKRSTLSQVATISSQPEEPTIETRNKEALSRVVMAALRMHGMQQRKKSKSQRNSVGQGAEIEQSNETAIAEESAKDEEYKIIYHQTFKGAAVALVCIRTYTLNLSSLQVKPTNTAQRKHMKTESLHAQPDRLRDVVEKLLAIFCTDPLALPMPIESSADSLATPGGKKILGVVGSSHSHASPFDLPSGVRLKAVPSLAEEHVHTGSPVSRKVIKSVSEAI